MTMHRVCSLPQETVGTTDHGGGSSTCVSFPHLFTCFRLHPFFLLVVSIDGSFVRGTTLGVISCAGLVFVDQETLRFCCRGRCLCFLFLPPFARVLGVAAKC